MPVDKIELAKDLATPEYQAIVRDELTKLKFAVRDEAAEKTYLENYGKQYEETTIKPKIAAVHGQYEKDIMEIFPDFKRNEQESTYDAMKRVGKAKVGEYAAKISQLEEQIKKGDPTGTLAAKLTQVEEEARVKIEGLNKQLNEYKGKATFLEKQGSVQSVYSGVKATFKKDKPAMFERAEKVILDEVYASSGPYDIGGGKQVLCMFNPDGTVKRDAQYSPITVESYLKSEFKDLIDDKSGKGGAGSEGGGKGGDNGGNPDTITPENFVMPENIKDANALNGYMMDIGLKRGTPNYNAIYKKFSANLPLFGPIQ